MAMRALSDEDAQVEPQRGVLEVPDVELDPLGPRQRRAAVDLRPAGQAGPDGEPLPLAVRVVVDLDLQRRARPDQRHLAAQDVDQVRQLVDRRAAQERADARDPRVALVDRHARRPCARRRVTIVRSLTTSNACPSLADAVLAVDRVAAALQAHRERRDAR